MAAEMEKGIEGIDPRPAISSPFLPSVKQVPRGDGFLLPKEWINGGRTGGSGCALDPAEWCSPLGGMEVADVLLTRLQEKSSRQRLRRSGERRNSLHSYSQANKCTHTHTHTHTTLPEYL